MRANRSAKIHTCKWLFCCTMYVSTRCCSDLVTSNARRQSTLHHTLQSFLFTLGLTCQLGAAVTKPRYVILHTNDTHSLQFQLEVATRTHRDTHSLQFQLESQPEHTDETRTAFSFRWRSQPEHTNETRITLNLKLFTTQKKSENTNCQK